MDKEKRRKLYREHNYEIFEMIDEIIAQRPLRPCDPSKEVQEKYEKELANFNKTKKEEIRKRFIEMGFELEDNWKFV